MARLTRRALVQAAPALGLAGIRSVSARAEERPTITMNRSTLTILHTNDFHGHIEPWIGWEGDLAGKTIGGLAHLATAVERVRREVGPDRVALLDAGDAISDTMLANETRGQAVLELMEAIGYHALAIGNHEPDFTAGRLRAYMRSGRIPLLAANITDRATGRPFFKPFIIHEVAGVKVGILGLGYPNTPLTTAKKNVAELDFHLDSAFVVQQYLPQLRQQGAQLIVVLSHLGLGADLRLAESVKGVDVIAGGHSHNRMADAIKVGQTLIVQSGAHGSDLGRLDLTVENGRIKAHERELIPLDHDSLPADARIAKMIDQIASPLRNRLNEIIAEATTAVVRAQTLAGQQPRHRDQQSPADSLFADILREVTGSDLALLPGVGYGVALQAGPITAGGLRNLVPHESKVVTMSLSGEQVLRVLEQAVENIFSDDPKKKVGGMIQVSGLRFSYEPEAEAFRRVRDVKAGSTPLNPQHTYGVATNSMLAAGGHHYEALIHGRERKEHQQQYEVIRDWMKEKGRIQIPTDVRIQRA
ncbi:MAG: thiosulfohydrolase SoxB [Phycisphaerae bacterium]